MPTKVRQVLSLPSWMEEAAPGSPKPKFVIEECWWPTWVGPDDLFTPRLVWVNEGGIGLADLMMQYKGDYWWISTSSMEPNEKLSTYGEITMRQFLGGLETFETSKTVDITFLVGVTYAEEYYETDKYPVSTYVGVKGFPIPAWALALGAGAMVMGGGIALVATRR